MSARELDPRPEFVTIDGDKYCYRKSGHGPPIVLLHGLSETSKYFWRKFIAHFEDRYEIFALDLRGHGDSVKPRSGYKPGDQAEWIAKFIKELQIERPVLLGHSLGGIIAGKFAIMYPDSLSKLVIYDSPLAEGFWSAVRLGFRMPLAVLILGPLLIPGLGRLVFRFRSPKTMRMTLNAIHVFCDRSHFNAELLQESLQSSYEALSGSIWRAVIRENYLDDLRQISVPTLLIWGDYDSVVPTARMERAHERIKNSKKVLLQKAGHLSLIEKPDEFNNAVDEFLQET